MIFPPTRRIAPVKMTNSDNPTAAALEMAREMRLAREGIQIRAWRDGSIAETKARMDKGDAAAILRAQAKAWLEFKQITEKAMGRSSLLSDRIDQRIAAYLKAAEGLSNANG